MAPWIRALLLIALLLHGQAWTRSACECRDGAECGSAACTASGRRAVAPKHPTRSCCHAKGGGSESDAPSGRPCDCGCCGRVEAGPLLNVSDAPDLARGGRAIAPSGDLPATVLACTAPSPCAAGEIRARGLHGPPGSPSSATPALLPVLRY